MPTPVLGILKGIEGETLQLQGKYEEIARKRPCPCPWLAWKSKGTLRGNRAIRKEIYGKPVQISWDS